MRVWGFDPGGTTGWAWFDLDAPQGVERFHCGMLGPDPHHEELWRFLNESIHPEDHIVCESFQYRNGLDKAELWSVEYIGIIKLFRDWIDVLTIFQTAGMGKVGPKSFTKKAHLERLGLWRSGPSHPMDAYGHVLYYMINGGDPKFSDIRLKLLKAGWKPE